MSLTDLSSTPRVGALRDVSSMSSASFQVRTLSRLWLDNQKHSRHSRRAGLVPDSNLNYRMEQPQLTPEAPPEAPPPPAMSLVGRLLNVFATPGDVFQEVKAAPETAANWLVPALILIAVSWAAAG